MIADEQIEFVTPNDFPLPEGGLNFRWPDDRWTQDSRILFLEEPPGVEPTFRALSSKPRTNSKDWADSYLGAFAEVGGMKFVTFDKGFQGRLERLVVLKT